MTLKDPISKGATVAVVSVYLLLVAAWLVLTRQIRAPGVFRIARATFRPRFSATISKVGPEAGYCYLAPLPPQLPSDAENASRLQLFEDGRQLGPAHSAHDDIRQLGTGRFSHWGAQLYFSASDNSDPRHNGRTYVVREAAR